jgi:hypothetical protein
MKPGLTYRPLSGGWTDPLTAGRKSNPFSAKWTETKSLLLYEAERLAARDVVIELDVDEGDILASGEGLKANRRMRDFPGAVVRLVGTRHGDLRYACDTFAGRWSGDPPDWQINVRAIAVGLEALRKVERYGLGSRGEQYVGWKAIGAGVAMSAIPQPLTLQEAAAILADAVGGTAASVLADFDAAKNCHRTAVRLLHPDHGGTGDGARMARLAEAWDLVREHHAR